MISRISLVALLTLALAVPPHSRSRRRFKKSPSTIPLAAAAPGRCSSRRKAAITRNTAWM